MKDGTHGYSNRELLERYGETCTEKNICSSCDAQFNCRKEIKERYK